MNLNVFADMLLQTQLLRAIDIRVGITKHRGKDIAHFGRVVLFFSQRPWHITIHNFWRSLARVRPKIAVQYHSDADYHETDHEQLHYDK